MAETKIGRLLDVIESTWTNPDTKVEVPQLKAILVIANGEDLAVTITSKAAYERLQNEIGNYFQYTERMYDMIKGQPLYTRKIAFKVESPV